MVSLPINGVKQGREAIRSRRSLSIFRVGRGAPEFGAGGASLPARRHGERRIDRNQTPRRRLACARWLSPAIERIRPRERKGPPMNLPPAPARWKRRVPRFFSLNIRQL